MKKIFLLSAFSLAGFAIGDPPKLACVNQRHRVALEPSGKELSLVISSEDSTPLLPDLDPRIRRIVIGPMPCAQTLGHATVCYTNVCHYEEFYGDDGKRLDIEIGGAPLLTVTPDPDDRSDYLKVHFEWNGFEKRHVIEDRFEMYPGRSCEF